MPRYPLVKGPTHLMSQSQPPEAIPPSLQPWLAHAEWQPITIGLSGAEVYRIVAPGQPPRYLKSAAGPRVAELRAERDRLIWLRSRLPAPHVHAWVADEKRQRAWLLLSEAPGVMACEPAVASDPKRVVRALAEGLRQIHQLAAADCPFDMRLDARLAHTEEHIRLGLVDEVGVRANCGVSPSELLARLRATRPDEPLADLVFTHGDYCLPNILLDPASFRASAYLDWGRAGLADRYYDLAIAARSVRHNFGAHWGPRFLAAYGLDQPDQRRLDWYEALDELF